MQSTDTAWKAIPDTLATSTSPPASADVVVIGAGIAGLSVAYRLAVAGKQVVVLEANAVGSGMSGLTSAHLANVIDDRFKNLISVRGEENARIAAAAHGAAIDLIEATASIEGIDCEFRRIDAYLFAASPDDEQSLDEEANAARQAGLNPESLARSPHPGFRVGRCLRFPRQARFEPTSYLTGLARAVRKRGGAIITGCRVKSVEDGTPAKVVTESGQEVTARAVVVATNSPFNDRFRIHTKQFPYMTYLVGLKIDPRQVPDALMWDTRDPYHYVRLVGNPGDDGTDTLLVGGEDHKTGQAHDQQARFDRLEAWARDHYPAAGPLTHRWGGQVLETTDGLAYIGKNPGDENVYVVTGDSGMGLTHGSIAGLLIPDLIETGSHPWAEAFSPSRTPVRGIGEFVSENANVALQYADWLTGGDVDSLDEIRPGSGAVVRFGLTKVAVYRDPNGDFHGCSARCPHLGAVVQWNDAEKTWDCPAHGSRFDCHGHVHQGPANSNLVPMEVTSPAT